MECFARCIVWSSIYFWTLDFNIYDIVKLTQKSKFSSLIIRKTILYFQNLNIFKSHYCEIFMETMSSRFTRFSFEMRFLRVFHRKPQVHLKICIVIVIWYGRHMKKCLSGKIGCYGEIRDDEMFDIWYLMFDIWDLMWGLGFNLDLMKGIWPQIYIWFDWVKDLTLVLV